MEDRVQDALPDNLTVEEFLDWADTRRAARGDAGLSDEPKWELFDGTPWMQDHVLWVHARAKLAACVELAAAIRRAKLSLGLSDDGLGVRVSAKGSYQPDGVVFPLNLIADEDRFAPEPVIVIEVLSPSTRKKDLGEKVTGYGRVPSIAHYLAIDPVPGHVLHFRRGPKGLIRPKAPVAGPTLHLDPPGLDIRIGKLFG